MIDRGISENYVLLWLESERDIAERMEQYMRVARMISRRRKRSDKRTLIDCYDGALSAFKGNEIMAAEYLRRALIELSNPTAVDDSLPPPESWQWKHVYSSSWPPLLR